VAYFADTSSSGTQALVTDEVGGFTIDTNTISVGAGAGLQDPGTGAIVGVGTLTFSHTGSAASYTLDTEGNLTAS
jgi:hypothetical protein